MYKHRKLENFSLSSTHGAHASSLFSKWFACSHMQWCRAHTLFIILLTLCKPLFLCSVLNSHTSSIFLLPPEPPQGQELPLPFFFLNILQDSCSVGFRENMEKSFCGLPQPLGCRSAVLSSMPTATHLFQHWVQCSWSSIFSQ